MKKKQDFGILESRVKFEEPPPGANMARMLYEAFKAHSERTLLVDVAGQEEYTGAKLLDRVGRISTSLITKLGMREGSVALTLCDHTGMEMLLALGVVLAGGAIYGSSAEDGYSEEKMLCRLVKPDLIITHSRLYKSVLKLRQDVPGMANTGVVWIDSPSCKQLQEDLNNNNNNERDALDCISNAYSLEDLLEGQVDEKLLKEMVYERIEPEKHVLTYMLTSGSTDRPKVVRSTHEELMFGLYSMISANKYPVSQLNGFAADNASRLLLPMTRESVFSGDLPLDHGAGINTMFLSIYLGAKFIIMPSYREDIFWQSVHEHRISSSIASTTFTFKLLTRLKELIDLKQTDKWNLDCFKLITCCGSKMAFTDLAKEVNKVYKHINISQCYGATEMGFMAMLSTADCRTHLHSVGHLFPGMRAKVVDPDTGLSLGPNERGQLHVWSKSKFKSYMCHPDDDPAQMIAKCHDEQGFYITGDQVHYDHEERFYVHGRFKDTLFLMQDWKILPAELEEVVNEHPLVELSAVVGIPDRELPGCDAPRAFVKLIPPNSPSLETVDELRRKKLLDRDLAFIASDIYQFVAERTAKPKHLKGGVRILDELPSVGLLNKIDRKVLKLMD